MVTIASLMIDACSALPLSCNSSDLSEAPNESSPPYLIAGSPLASHVSEWNGYDCTLLLCNLFVLSRPPFALCSLSCTVELTLLSRLFVIQRRADGLHRTHRRGPFSAHCQRAAEIGEVQESKHRFERMSVEPRDR